MRNSLAYAALILCFACSLGGPLREDATALNNYSLPSPGAAWTQQDFKQSEIDRAYLNGKSSALISVASLCERYDTASLDSLMKSAHAPLRDVEVVQEKEIMLDGRAALVRQVKAKMDGVGVELFSTVVRKDDCIFDFHLQRAGSLASGDILDFENMLKGFRYSRGDRKK
jgi:hypothetical protein